MKMSDFWFILYVIMGIVTVYRITLPGLDSLTAGCMAATALIHSVYVNAKMIESVDTHEERSEQ